MAKLEFYRQQTTPRVIAPDVGGLGRIQSGLGQAGEAIARGAVVAGQMVERRNLEIEKRREDDAAIDASSKSIELTSRWIEEEQRLKTEAEEADNFEGFSDKATARYQELVNEYLPNLKSDKARAWFSERSGIQGLDVQKNSSVYQARSSVEKTVRVADESANSARRVVQIDPSKFSQAAGDLELIASRIPDKAAASKFYSQQRAILAQDAAVAAADKNPRQILAALDKPVGQTGFAYLDALDADSVDNVKATAERRIAIMEQERRAREAEAREVLRTQIDDQVAYMSVGITPDKMLTKAQFAAAGMVDRYEDYRATYNASATIVSLSTMPRAEAAEKIQSMRPTQEKGAAGNLKRFEMVSDAYTKMVQAQEADPAGYLVERNPAIRDAYDAIGRATTPADQAAASERFAAIVNIEARRIGINNKAVIPKALADDLINRSYGRTERDGAIVGAGAIIDERRKWGRYWPNVYSQIASKLPADAAVIGAGMREGPSNRLIEISAIKDEDLNKLLPSKISPKDLQDEISDIVQDVSASYVGQGGDLNTSLVLQNAIYRLAVDYTRNGKSAADAAQLAYQEVVGERYALAEIDDAIVRVPVTESVSNAQLRTGLREFRNEAIKELGIGTIRGSYWQTMPDDNRVVLMRDGQPVERADGSLFQYSWQQIKNRSATKGERIRRLDIEMGGRPE
jgi:hypothetical protein